MKVTTEYTLHALTPEEKTLLVAVLWEFVRNNPDTPDAFTARLVLEHLKPAQDTIAKRVLTLLRRAAGQVAWLSEHAARTVAYYQNMDKKQTDALVLTYLGENDLLQAITATLARIGN